MIAEYTRSSIPMDTDKIFDEMRYHLALKSLATISIARFDRGERSTICNHLSREIIQNTPDIALMNLKIAMLLKLVAIPSKSMHVLIKSNVLLGEESPAKEENNTAIPTRLAHNLDANQSQVHIGALSALKQLIRGILKYNT